MENRAYTGTEIMEMKRKMNKRSILIFAILVFFHLLVGIPMMIRYGTSIFNNGAPLWMQISAGLLLAMMCINFIYTALKNHSFNLALNDIWQQIQRSKAKKGETSKTVS